MDVTLLLALAAHDLDRTDAEKRFIDEAHKALAAVRNPPPRLIAPDKAQTTSASATIK